MHVYIINIVIAEPYF